MRSSWERAPATTGSDHDTRATKRAARAPFSLRFCGEGGARRVTRYFFFALLALLAWKRGLVPRWVG